MEEPAQIVDTFQCAGGELRIGVHLPTQAFSGPLGGKPSELFLCTVSVGGLLQAEHRFMGGSALQAAMQALLGVRHLLARQQDLLPVPALAEVWPSEGPFVADIVETVKEGREASLELVLGWPSLLPHPPGPAWVCLSRTQLRWRRGKRLIPTDPGSGLQGHVAPSPLLAMIAAARLLDSAWSDALLFAVEPQLGREPRSYEPSKKTSGELRSLFQQMRPMDPILDAVLAEYEGSAPGQEDGS